MRKLIALLLFAALPAVAAEMEREALKITSRDGGEYDFNVEVARTPQQLEDGLMYRTELADDAGMLFLFPREIDGVKFWMKNTLIPLDMIFIDKEGRVVRVHVNAKPEDLTPIPAGEPVLAVLELKGGRAADLGISRGDKVFSPSLALGGSGAAPKPELVEP